MYDSDDYFSDDLVLDDQTLAVLDEEESKFKRSTSSQQTQEDIGPPTKRQKTASTWQPSRALRRSDTLDDTEDLPDISIQNDGTYGLQDKQRPTPRPSSQVQVVSGPPALTQAGPGPTSTSSSRGSVPPSRGRSVMSLARVIHPRPPRPPPSTRTAPASRPPVSSQGIVRSQLAPQPRVAQGALSPSSDAHVAALHQQMEELRKKNEKMQADLQKSQAELESALNAKFAKDGEVTNLRKRIEKTVQDHSVQLAKLKTAKEEADAKQLLLQKQYEADRERLKTEFTFRQHELETTMRKPPGSVRPKKTAQGVPPTPVPVPSQIRAWGQSNAGPSRPHPESPRRPRFGVIPEFERPRRSAPTETRNLPSGFQAGPPRSQAVVGDKGKGKAIPAISASPIRSQANVPGRHSQHAPPSPPPSSPDRQASSSQSFQQDVFAAQMDGGVGMDDFAPPIDVDVPNDVDMADETNVAFTPSTVEDEIEEGVLPNWNIVLHRTILMHALEGSKASTLQLLMCASLADEGQVESYGSALTRILDTLASILNHPDRDFGQLARLVCHAFCEMANLLAVNGLLPPLTALLGLLTNLSYSLPSFHTPLLSLHVSEHDETPQLLSTLCGIIRDRLQRLDGTCEGDEPGLCSLGKKTLALLEALSWNTPWDLENVLSAIPLSPSILTTLLGAARPQWFLVDSTRLLLWLSTRRILFRPLLSFAEPEQAGNDGKPPDFTHLPQIDLLCKLLTDVDRTGPEADELKSNIIMIFGMLSNAHPDAYTLLIESQELIPSLVLYVFHLVTPIWEEDSAHSEDAQAISRTISMVIHTTLLLHHLVVGEESTLSLRDRLYRAPMKTYHGLIHFFILTFGRLSFADSPNWLDAKDKQRLEQVADLSRALLELVVEGPEIESIWGTYQDEVEDVNEVAMEVDDEEAEARKLESM
ncbi:hypothetical protein HYDPIDRAFT_165675 [Hydnomerulius pinastri MD-312]|nr:hypothetical protein HYDPIDRAFT_165675 [Hydnomerulius pinastri MD-312]